MAPPSRVTTIVPFDLHAVADTFKRTPPIADLKPNGKYVAKDLYEAGGVQVVIKELLDGGCLNGDALTVSGRTIAENHADVAFPEDQDVVHRASDPILADRRRRRSQGLAYAQTVGPAVKGAVTHPGARGERHVYADI